MRWLELTVETGVEGVEAVSEILCRLGRGAAVRPTRLIHDARDGLAAREDPAAPYIVTAHLTDGEEAAGAIERTERALWHLQAFGLGPIGSLSVRPVDDRDWTEAWRDGHVVQRIGRLAIVPSWLPEEAPPGAVSIRLDPGMAFGTGLHPTTRGCLELLQRGPSPPARVLDVGTGSGILAIAALKLGAARADALDTDPVAVAVARENAARNGLAGRLAVRRGTLPARPGERYPLVCANLVAALLVELSERLVAHVEAGGRLVAGGIVVDRGPDVEAALGAAGLAVHERLLDGDWLTLLLGAPA